MNYYGLSLVVIGSVMFLFGFITWMDDQPKIDLLSNGLSQLLLLNPQTFHNFTNILTEILISKIFVVVGIGLIIIGSVVIIKRPRKEK